MRKTIIISLIVICLVVVAAMPFFHVFYDGPGLILKEHPTLAGTFMSLKQYRSSYFNQNASLQNEMRETYLFQELNERHWIGGTRVEVRW
jgi:hypothetical protein